jgi:putative membrane protein
MIGIVLRMFIVALGLYVASTIVPGVVIDDLKTLVLATVLLSMINAVVRPVLVLLTLPVTVLTLGLFILVINALMFWLVTVFLPGVHVHSFGSALLGSIVVGVTSLIGNAFIGRERDRD